MNLNLNNKTVVVTGGGTGIGKETAKEFAREGARVSICGRRENCLAEVKAELQQEGLDCDYYVVDVTDTNALKTMAEEIRVKNNGIDVWVNNAGVDINKPVLDFDDEDYARIMKTNVESVYEGCRIAGKIMIEQGRGGAIINASSYATIIPHSDGVIYAASKASVASFTKTFAACFAPYGIRVCSYIPGMIATEMSAEEIQQNEELYVQNIPMRRLGKPEDLAKPIVFLASDACSYVTGFEFQVTGGKYSVQDVMLPWKLSGKL